MKQLFLSVVVALFTTLLFAQPSKHVVLVTIDGLRPEFYLSDTFCMPTVRQLMQKGAYSKQVTSVFPTVTYPNHTAIITGAVPAKHGVYSNEPFEPEGITGRWFWYADSIKVPTLFDAVHQQGMTSAAILWPAQVGAKIDYNIPEIWDVKTYDHVEPVKKVIYPASLWREIEENATGKLETEDLSEDRFALDENTTRIASYLIRQYKPSFVALHLICTDAQQHAQGRGGAKVKLAVSGADHCIGQLLEALERAGIKDSTTLIITGDHGFVDIHTTLFPNIWLAQKGFIRGKEWSAKFQSGRGSGFLRLNTAKLSKAEQAQTLAEVRKLLTTLPDTTRNRFRIIERKELDELGAYKDAVLAIVPNDGFSIGAAETGADMRPAAQKGTHGYLPGNPKMKTGFIAYGAGIPTGVMIPEMRLVDIAPLIARLLGLTFAAPDGIVPRQL